MTNAKDPRGAMESTLATSNSASGPVTFSHVFGQQCQLMEAGRKCAVWEAGHFPELPVAEAPVCLSVCLSVPSLPRCHLVCEVQLAMDVIVWHIHFKVFGTCHRTECSTLVKGREGPPFVSCDLFLLWLRSR